jgi:hypothetical protein
MRGKKGVIVLGMFFFLLCEHTTDNVGVRY